MHREDRARRASQLVAQRLGYDFTRQEFNDETISGYTSPVVVNIYGNNLDDLDQKAQQIAAVMQDIEGATDVQLRAPPGEPQLEVRLLLDELAHWGLRPADVMQTVKTGFEGAVVGQINEGNRVFDVVVVLPAELRQQPQDVLDLPIQTPDGPSIELVSEEDQSLQLAFQIPTEWRRSYFELCRKPQLCISLKEMQNHRKN